MASIRHEITTTATPDDVWAALRDFGAPHERLVRGFVTATETDGADRIVTFFTGTQVRERLVGIDEEHRRLAYAIARRLRALPGLRDGVRAGRAPAAG